MKYKILLFAFSISLAQLSAQVSWKKMASLPGAARNHAIGFSHGTMGYVMTGVGTSLLKDFWEYNSLTDSWKQLANYPGPSRSYGVGYVIGDKAYVGFGHSTSGYEVDWWQYDFTTSKWTQKQDFPGAGRDHPGCAIMNGKLYMGFGDNSSGSINDWWQYDPASDIWTKKKNYPGVQMHHPVTAQSNSLIYLSEGHLVSGSIDAGSKKFYSYNVTNDTWATLMDMPGLGVVAGASFFIGDNKIYSGAGITEPNTSFHKEFYAYDITAGTWNPIASYPGNGVFGPVSFVIGSEGYVTTGEASSGTSVQDLYKLSSPVSVENINPLGELRICPNPAVSAFTISGATTGTEKINYAMFNGMGEEIKSGSMHSSGNSFTGAVGTNDIPRGVYFLRIYDEKTTIIKKIIVQ